MNKLFLLIIGTLFTASLFIFCSKQEDVNPTVQVFAGMAGPCDSLKNVLWADTLHVVPNTISKTLIRRGKPYAGKYCWQAMLSSDGRVDPTNFKNDPLKHRVVIGDTLEITYSDIFIISRIK